MTRRLVLAAVVTSALCASAAAAGPRPYCHVIRDVQGDTGPQEVAVPGSTGDVDLVSADVATNARHLTAVVRVRDLTPDDVTAAAQGRHYELYFSADGAHHYQFVASLGSRREYLLYRVANAWITPENEGSGPRGSGPPVLLATAKGAFDTVRNEIRMTVPLTAFGSRVLRAGTTLYLFGATTTRSFGDFEGSAVPSYVPLPNGSTARPLIHPGNAWDAANGARTDVYPVGARSCVTVG